jgi:hypothetical protein
MLLVDHGAKFMPGKNRLGSRSDKTQQMNILWANSIEGSKNQPPFSS